MEVHQPAEGEEPGALGIDGVGEGLVFGRQIAAHGVLQAGHRFGRPGVILAAQAKGVGAADIEHGPIDRRIAIGALVALDAFAGNLA